MSDHPRSTFARRVRAARPRDKRFEVRDDFPARPPTRHGELMRGRLFFMLMRRQISPII